MVVRLTEHLAVPLRERNIILTAAGFAPMYPERSLDAPEVAVARGAIDQILRGHEPHPAWQWTEIGHYYWQTRP